MNPLMRLGRRKGFGTYYAEYDNRTRKSLKTKNKDEATRLYNAEKKAVRDGKIHGILGECDKSLKDLRTEFEKLMEPVQNKSTYRANMLALEKLVYVAGESCKLDKITVKHIDQIKADHAKLSPASVNNYIRHAKAVLKKAEDWGWVRVNPLGKVKEVRLEKKPPAFLDRKQASEFIVSIKDVDLRRLVVAYLTTGRRRSELLNLEWKDIDFEGGRYFVRKSKNHLTKWYPINAMFKAVLSSLPDRTGRVFKRYSHPDTLSHYIKVALVGAGFGHLHLHNLRHSFASIKVMEGKSLFEVGQLLGHTSITATQIYSHLSDSHMAEISEMNFGPVDLG